MELIWLLVTVSGAAGILLWLSLPLPWPQCTFRALFGIPCLTCGATRAALAFLHGNFLSAWRFNPMAALGFGLIALFDAYAFAVLASRAPRLRPAFAGQNQRRAAAGLIVSAALVNWIYLLRHF